MKRIISVILAVCLTASLAVCAQARPLGDVNKDGKVNSSDALDVILYSVGRITKIDEGRADVNIDGEINSSDALIILQIAVGSYQGELEIEDEFVTSFKKDTIDPILNTGKYTITTAVISNGTSVPLTMMVNGNNMSVDISVKLLLIETTLRMIVLDGKCYLAIPQLKVYDETELVPPASFTGSGKNEYVKSEYFENNGKTYVIETYKATDGTVSQYYFLNGEWKSLVKVAPDGTSTTQRIDKFEAGVNEANFSLKGYRQSDLSKYL